MTNLRGSRTYGPNMSRNSHSQWSKGKWGHGIPKSEWSQQFKSRAKRREGKKTRVRAFTHPVTAVIPQQIQFLRHWGIQWTPPNYAAAQNAILQIMQSKRYKASFATPQRQDGTRYPDSSKCEMESVSHCRHAATPESKPASRTLIVGRQHAAAWPTYDLETPTTAPSPDVDARAATEPSTSENQPPGNQNRQCEIRLDPAVAPMASPSRSRHSGLPGSSCPRKG